MKLLFFLGFAVVLLASLPDRSSFVDVRARAIERYGSPMWGSRSGSYQANYVRPAVNVATVILVEVEGVSVQRLAGR